MWPCLHVQAAANWPLLLKVPPSTVDPGPSWDSEKRGHCSLTVGEAGVGAGTLDRSWGQEQLYTLLAG